DTVLSAPWIGSGVLCHEAPEGMREVKSPHDLALVNLFVRREEFVEAGGFDEAVGYIGEDSDLVARMIERGRAVYHSNVLVFHRRRRFPFEYIRQRWRYRTKMGESLLEPESRYRKSSKIWIFLGGTLGFLLIIAIAPLTGIVLFFLYVVATLIAGSSATRLPVYWWPIIPFAFMIHHATYFLGIVWGVGKGVAGRIFTPRKAVAGSKDG
ncbi:MAG: glycosyltransferase family 2 protein, partial [Thermoanaerobaculia bacterium]|nr:glycosyltransferase family 2 protein [Thermoanaerobaculia bacterium]